MDMPIVEVSGRVHALIEDLLPVVFPGATFDAPTARVIFPVGRYARGVSTWIALERCAREPSERWPRLVEDWIREAGDLVVLSIADIELLGDVRELLRLRIVPKLSDADREPLMAVTAGPFFDGVIVIDHPEYGGPLTKARANLLGLRRLGYVVARTHEEVADVDVRDQPLTLRESVRVVSKPGSRYVPVLLTEIARFVPEAGPEGALFSVPTHSTMLLHPLTSPARDALPAFADVTEEMHASSSDPCAPTTFRWRRGEPMERLRS
ncbi:hypothetical protein BZB76_3239 [Actinomadura pelletieri DSM 43383]|uniref:Uncharacterized protein n=1 Tax=Actinomadura pelletieri DSM 43383 TaxID=1120940 RepID=A0A495QPB9_9ACTN|nr:hypothetical protein [Actinomadura pelletieri]RKS74722.1 hypothetical protein BZB76_3239 [Actinomadura pelletieri DSM 43383]